MILRTAALALAAIPPAAAAGAGGIAIPEPSDPWLFALGVIGLLVGRHVAKRKPPN